MTAWWCPPHRRDRRGISLGNGSPSATWIDGDSGASGTRPALAMLAWTNIGGRALPSLVARWPQETSGHDDKIRTGTREGAKDR
jgi:hypothetical protein